VFIQFIIFAAFSEFRFSEQPAFNVRNYFPTGVCALICFNCGQYDKVMFPLCLKLFLCSRYVFGFEVLSVVTVKSVDLVGQSSM
jgi:hypothetical protein